MIGVLSIINFHCRKIKEIGRAACARGPETANNFFLTSMHVVLQTFHIFDIRKFFYIFTEFSRYAPVLHNAYQLIVH